MNEEYDLFTTSSVLSEIRDEKARALMNKYIDVLKVIQDPSQDSISYVKKFSKKTGDFQSLSLTDIELIAAAVDICKRRKTLGKLRKEPPSLSQFFVEETSTQDKLLKQQNVEVEVEQQLQQQDNDGFTVVESKKQKKLKQKQDVIHQQSNNDDQTWINTENLATFLSGGINQPRKANQLDENTSAELGVAIMTTDFAMQNVIIQIGIPLISIDNQLITQTKRFVLECFACLEICRQMEKQFCPKCGHHTLLKLSCHANSDGTVTYFRKKNFSVNTRGQQYPIPKAIGGRNNADLLLNEDEFMMYGRDIKLRQQENQNDKSYRKAVFNLDHGVDFGAPLQMKNAKNTQNLKYGYGRINPNDVQQIKHKHKK